MTVRIVPLDTPHLGNRSYLVHDGTVAVAVDVPRDIDRVIGLAAREGVRIGLVVDTHGHGDWLTGGPVLARLVGARYAAPAEVAEGQRQVTVTDGTTLPVGELVLRAVHTPGHTLGHVSYVVESGGQVAGVLTGGSLLHGAVGRPDLIGPQHTERLAHQQWASVRALADQLPAETPVLPMHGFGSFCSASSTSADSSTIADQRAANPALTQDEGRFVAELLAGLDAYPAYYVHMAPANLAGPAPIDLTPPAPADAAEIRRRVDAGEWVVDLRSRTAFAAGHLPGTYSFDASENVVTYLGWLLPHGMPVTLLGETAEAVAAVQRELALIGVDRPAAAAVGTLADWAAGAPVRSFRRATFAELGRERGVTVLDVRRTSEWQAGHLETAVHIPLHELPGRLDEVPDGPVWVHCAGGFRASVAAAILDRTGRHEVVTIDDGFVHAAEAGAVVTEESRTAA